MPLGIAKGLNFFLTTYPYGCSEQLASAAFPFLYPELSREMKFPSAVGQASVARVVAILQARLKRDYSIGIWTSLSDSDPLITAYCAHFLTEAKAKGHYVSTTLLNSVTQGLKTIADGKGTDDYSLTCRAYAIYVLTLNEQITTTQLETLKKDIARENSAAETGFPGLFMAGSYAMLQKNIDAAALLLKIKLSYAFKDNFPYLDSLAYESLYLNVVARHFPQNLKDVSGKMLESMADELKGHNYTTISASLALMAIDAYLKATPTAETGAYAVAQIAADKTRTALTPKGDPVFTASYTGTAEKIAVENRDNVPLFYQVTQAGFDLEVPKSETKNGIEVYREFTDADGKKIDKATVGDVVYVKLNFRSLSKATIRDVALVDLLPAGLEADIASIRDNRNVRWSPDYVDIREDRLVVFGRVTPELNTFTYQTRAVNKGNFVVPPLFAEALYDKKVWAMRPQDRLTIVGK